MSALGKHPKGLPYLFLTEMWERFGYYLMIGIFVLYMTDFEKGGLNFDREQAADIFGTFIALNYLTPFIGGVDHFWKWFFQTKYHYHFRKFIFGRVL